MNAIEEWIDTRLTELVADQRGYIVLSDDNIEDLAQVLGLARKPSTSIEKESLRVPTAVRAYIFFHVDANRDCFQEKLEDFRKNYEKQERLTGRHVEVISCP